MVLSVNVEKLGDIGRIKIRRIWHYIVRNFFRMKVQMLFIVPVSLSGLFTRPVTGGLSSRRALYEERAAYAATYLRYTVPLVLRISLRFPGRTGSHSRFVSRFIPREQC